MTKQLPHWYILSVTLLLTAVIGYFFINILIYLLFAVVLSFIGRPIMNFVTSIHFKKQQVPRWLGAVLTIVVLLSIFSLAWAIFIPIIVSQAREFGNIDYAALQQQLEAPLEELNEFVFRYSLIDTEDKTLTDYLILQLKNFANFSFFSDVFNNIMSITMEFFLAFFSILFILFFFLKDRDMFFKIIMTLTPDQHEGKMGESIDSIKKLLTRYFLGVVLQISIVFTIMAVGLYLVGLDNFLLIAFIAAFFNLIPYVGPFIGFFIGLLLGVSMHLDINLATQLLPLVLQITLVFAIAQFIDNFFSQPYIFSNSVKAHPLEIFILILAAGSVGGILAMVMAIPTYTAFRVIGKEFFSDSKIVRSLTKSL